MSLEIRHVELKEANDFVATHHRHHKPVLSHRFSIGVVSTDCACGVCADSEHSRGVAIVGRPVARMVNFKSTLEVTRLCTDGTKNACSILYAAAARAGKELGYSKIQTYILDSEPGTSLIAAGWVMEARSAGGDWNRPSRGGRRTDQPQEPKTRWAKQLR